MSYLIDTNSLIDADLKWYKPNIFPTIWNELDSRKDIIIVPEVNKEILSPNNLVSWSKKKQKQCSLTSSKEVLNNYSKILDWIGNCKRWSKAGFEQWGLDPSKADPWLIAYALTYNYTIVTMDGNGRATLPDANANSNREPKISAVAGKFGVKTITIYELIEDLKIVL